MDEQATITVTLIKYARLNILGKEKKNQISKKILSYINYWPKVFHTINEFSI